MMHLSSTLIGPILHPTIRLDIPTGQVIDPSDGHYILTLDTLHVPLLMIVDLLPLDEPHKRERGHDHNQVLLRKVLSQDIPNILMNLSDGWTNTMVS